MLQWVHGWITVVIGADYHLHLGDCIASMGPRLDNRGYRKLERAEGRPDWASMDPRLDNRGYHPGDKDAEAKFKASMGPRLDNRGYPARPPGTTSGSNTLQWVHGWITVVIMVGESLQTASVKLQWVHGWITVVI